MPPHKNSFKKIDFVQKILYLVTKSYMYKKIL